MKKYSISLDTGVGGVGFAVVDNQYNVVKVRGKNYWGVRLFDEAKTAKARRLSRSARRRYDRRRTRISLLKNQMGSIVLDVDADFFFRLEKGALVPNEKGSYYNLFADNHYNDADFYGDFKTIYHLRNHLMNSDEKADPRMIYLALHHIIKYRGNFLYGEGNFDVEDSSDILDKLYDCFTKMQSIENEGISVEKKTVRETLDTLADTKIVKKVRIEKALKLISNLDKSLTKVFETFYGLVVGNSISLNSLYPEVDFDQKDNKIKFKDSEIEEILEKTVNSGIDDTTFIENAYKVYSYITLNEVLNDCNTISKAMIKRYDKHGKDLKILRKIIKGNFSGKYKEFFRTENKGSYGGYIKNAKVTTTEVFYKKIKDILKDDEEFKESQEYKEVISDIDNNTFLQKQTSKDNAYIPYQLNLIELEKIIEKQGKYYPVLLEQKEKIVSLLTFRVPYYVGPLNNSSSFAWIVKKGKEKIYPWNFEEEVDLIASAEIFIKRMTNQCAYLYNSDNGVLPKKSLLYSRFEVLNELNMIRINGKRIGDDAKKSLLENVFLKVKTVTHKKVSTYLYENGFVDSLDAIITGTQKEKEFATSLESWIDFEKIFGEDFKKGKDIIEKLIEWVTVYEDKKILELRIRKEFPELEDILPQILKLKYKGWGKLSRKLLEELRVQDSRGTFLSIIDILEEKRTNLMKILTDKRYDFEGLINSENGFDDKIKKINYSKHIEPLVTSPKNKKGIWQACKVVEEIVHYMGCEPENIFVEVARSDNEKKRTKSRVARIEELYKEEKKTNNQEYLNSKLSDIKKTTMSTEQYLYFLQFGKCMYSGNALDFDSLNLYEVDHIIPQFYITDNSLDNLALVIKSENQRKSTDLLLDDTIIDKHAGWWKALHEKGMISEKKYRNLIRRELSDVEKLKFINRQLVETRQITKEVGSLLKSRFSSSNVVALKAGLTSDFRKKFDIFKVRDLNNYHHTHDAYINAVIGIYVLNKYPKLKSEFMFDEISEITAFSSNLKKVGHNFKSYKYGYIINGMGSESISNETGEVLWKGSSQIEQIKKTIEKKDYFVTKQLEESTGSLFNVTIINKEKATKAIANNTIVISVNKKRKDVEKYGGFGGIENAYARAISYSKGKKKKRTLINIPIIYSKNESKIDEYIKKQLKIKEYKIIKKKVLFNQLFETSGGKYRLASANEWTNAIEMVLSSGSLSTLSRLQSNEELDKEELGNLYTEIIDKVNNHYPLLKSFVGKLEDFKEGFNHLNQLEKKKLIGEILKGTLAGKTRGEYSNEDLKLKLSGFGRLTSKTINLDETTFFDESVSGIFTKKYKL